MQYIDMIRIVCGMAMLTFLFEFWENGGSPEICLPAAIIAGILLTIAEVKHLHNELKRRG
jgi:hypothetical protein